MDPNRPTELQQPQRQLEPEQRRRQPYPEPSQSNTAGTQTWAGHSDAFIPFPEPGTTRNDIAQSSVPAPIRRAASLNHEHDVEAGLSSSPPLRPISLQRVVTPDRSNTSNTATSPYDVTPLPPAMVTSRQGTNFPDTNDRSLRSAYSKLVSTVGPFVRDLRTSLAPDQPLDSSSTMHTRPETENVPVGEKPPYREKTVAERLQDTLDHATAEKTKYAAKARLTGYALNIAIGLQVVLGSLTTALSVVTSGKQTAIMTAILGGFTTVVASYLARARGSNEPELSITRVKDLEQFLRQGEAFKTDHGHVTGDKFDNELEWFRRRFEELLGNANGERKLSG